MKMDCQNALTVAFTSLLSLIPTKLIVNLVMEIVIKNLKEKHLTLMMELAHSLDFEISNPAKDSSTYDPEFVAKIKQGDEDIKAGRTKKITLDDIWK